MPPPRDNPGSATTKTTRNPSSVFSLVRQRQGAQIRGGSFGFQRRISKFLEGDKELLMDPELVSPHRTVIASLAVDPAMGRFVLAGSSDATVSIYDLSHWGSEGVTRNLTESSSYMRFQPVARSIRVPLGLPAGTGAGGGDDSLRQVLEVPSGHSAAITHVQWHPVDPGAFVTCGNEGHILLWDTTQMTPVLKAAPFAHSMQDHPKAATWGSAHWQQPGGAGAGGGGETHTTGSLVVTGSWSDAAVKLVDLRSGASSHQLTGHSRGITAVQWSPAHPAVVASGSQDGTIRLWDIRKAGSMACLAVLGRGSNNTTTTTSSTLSDPTAMVATPPYQADCSHLRKFAVAVQKQKQRNRRKRKLVVGSSSSSSSSSSRTADPVVAVVAPNNYRHVQQQRIQSHHGYVASLAFLPGGQTLASVGGTDGELLLWDLRHGPTLLERKFVAPGGLPAAGTPRQRQTPSSGGGRRQGGGAALCVDAEKDMIWIGHQSTIMGFSVREGGSPRQILRGHLNDVTSLARIRPEMTLLSGSSDGMILSWGKRKGAMFAPKNPTVTLDEDNW